MDHRLWILELAKARAQGRYPQRSRPSEQRRPTPKSTQPLTARGRRAAGRVARSLQPHCGDAPPSLLAIRPSASTRDPSQYFNSLLAELTSARGGSFDCEPKTIRGALFFHHGQTGGRRSTRGDNHSAEFF